jgi:hypothetical protein
MSTQQSAHLTICPECGAPLQTNLSASDTIGYRLHDVWDSPSELPLAVSVELPIADPPAGR